MAAISPEVSRCHVCFGSCVLKGVLLVGQLTEAKWWLRDGQGGQQRLRGFQERLHLGSFRGANGPSYHLSL